ncbi:peptidase T [Caproiciproducens faecalis]|uniref:Peptidase T n=1 Tax=Caproiciproducens faecalis TaxID=2820301 RepID=A0ABS7DTF8_9FIRM|nr:peptidase T [Caproiciproducens faecalis]MBW7573871.1 peptidase T [Caproiciproducens faecalis]
MRAYERFLKYVAFDTTSDESAPESVCPSTEKQKALAKALVEEMKELGLTDARMDEYGYVYGTLPANCEEKLPVIGLISHMDTSPSASGAGIKPRIVEHYDGGDIVLNEEKQIVMSPAQFESLRDYKGKDLIVTDGTTLLGADDKAGVAEIMTVLERLGDGEVRHGKIAVGFTPDEEIGRGADRFDVAHFGADYAYTVDGGKLGELEYENFNAAAAMVTVNGVNIHPGDAKNRMKNALLMGIEFNSMLPPNEIPACTEGYEGFHHLSHMEGDEEKTVLRYIIRDHNMEKFTEKKSRFEKVAGYLNEKYGDNTVELTLHDSYFNMKEKIEPHMFIIEKAKKAMEDAGVEPEIVAIRGGTDGARLSFMGLPCPNLSTGGHNFHGRFEYIPVQSMDSMVEVLRNIVKAQ